jgi:hypothetical protein
MKQTSASSRGATVLKISGGPDSRTSTCRQTHTHDRHTPPRHATGSRIAHRVGQHNGVLLAVAVQVFERNTNIEHGVGPATTRAHTNG